MVEDLQGVPTIIPTAEKPMYVPEQAVEEHLTNFLESREFQAQSPACRAFSVSLWK